MAKGNLDNLARGIPLLHFYRDIKEFGFQEDMIERKGGMVGWNQSEFIMPQRDSVPEIRLKIKEHNRYGVNLTLSSSPWDTLYHFFTPRSVSHEQASKHLMGYLVSVSNGKKYEGKQISA